MQAATSPGSVDAEIDAPYDLAPDAAARYARDGFAHLGGVFSPAALASFDDEFTRLVYAEIPKLVPLAQRDTYGKAFLQVGQLWLKSERAKRFVFGRRLARIAAELMGTRGVRMYHDQALYKEVQGGFTPWHCDQQYWPLASDKSITAWIPLQEVPIDMGPLAFAAGSHHYTGGRHLAIGDESEETLERDLVAYPYIEEPFALGDVSFHAGWTYHRARGNTTGRCRKVMTIIFMDIDMRLAQPSNPNQEGDRKYCAPGVAVGDIIASPVNPVMWER
ncbi:MAG TPA: phytanoyl-CoA dioxygenase family protein [Planctomycetota bacterium]|nr:phytanoyl-CoA dioxygenase family protein [Planctomycetota bacterium]